MENQANISEIRYKFHDFWGAYNLSISSTGKITCETTTDVPAPILNGTLTDNEKSTLLILISNLPNKDFINSEARWSKPNITIEVDKKKFSIPLEKHPKELSSVIELANFLNQVIHRLSSGNDEMR